MKKYFFFAIAALGMIAGCQKNQIEPTPVDDNDQVAIQFGINAPSLAVSKTKAAVDVWGGQTVYVYGFTNKDAALGAGKYDVTAPFINAVSATASHDVNASTDEQKRIAALEVYKDAQTNLPYYYSLNDTYDFYGFYLGDITPGTPVTGTDMISYALTIDGSQDIMYAKASQEADVQKVIDNSPTSTLTPDDAQYAYSAWAARRGVHPTLVFQHALTRFNFYIKGAGTKYNTVTVTNIQAKSPATGVLTVVGDELGYVADDVTATPLDLKNADGTDFVSQTVTNVAALAGDCIMVAPNMESIDFVVETKDATAGTLPTTNITLTPDLVEAGLTKFAAGHAYNVTIIVYGPEEISITAELTKWEEGGEYEYDPDNEMKPGTGSTPSTPVTPAAAIENLKLSFIYDKASYNAENIYAEYLTANPWDTDWDEVPSAPWLSAVFTENVPDGQNVTIELVKIDGWDSSESPVLIADDVDDELNAKYSERGTAVVENGKLIVPAGYLKCGGIMFDGTDVQDGEIEAWSSYRIEITVGADKFEATANSIAS